MKNKTIEALEKLIVLKDETIKELERQVLLLKSQPPVIVPQLPEQPYQPVNPWAPVNPQWPWSQPWYGGPYIITSGTSATIPNDPNATYTLQTSDGTSNILNLKDIPRVG
jgi:hypothetical protein